MHDTVSRRKLLQLGAVGLTGLAGCESGNGDSGTSTRTSENSQTAATTSTESSQSTTDAEPPPVDAIEHDRLVGAQYYAWYWGDDGFGGQRLADDRPDSWLSATPGEPVLGAYDSRAAGTVDRHMRWSLEHGINWWILTGGAPNGPIDRTIRNAVFEGAYADQMNFTLLLGFPPAIREDDGTYDFDDPDAKAILARWFEHWESEYVSDPNYLRLGDDDRPALYFWSIGQAAGDMAGAFEAARDAVDVDPYLIGGPDYFHQPRRIDYYTDTFDALLDYHSYFPNEQFLEQFEERVVENHHRWRAAAHEYDAAFIPTVTPGFDHSEAPATFRDGRTLPSLERDADRFQTHCRELRGLGDHDAIVVTSFNEWLEYSGIEPSEEYGTTYLDVVASELAEADWEPPSPQPYTQLDLDFDRTYRPETLRSDSEDGRHLAFLASELVVETGGTTVHVDVGGDEGRVFYTAGVYKPEHHEGSDWRWFGGREGRTRLFVPVEDVSGLTLVGHAIQDDVSVVVRAGDSELGRVALDTAIGRYSVS